MPSSRAAAVKLPASMTRANTTISLRSSIVSKSGTMFSNYRLLWFNVTDLNFASLEQKEQRYDHQTKRSGYRRYGSARRRGCARTAIERTSRQSTYAQAGQ